MAWDKIIGQERVKRILHAAFTTNRLSHAFLFYGLEGVGKDAVAIELARTLNCTQGGWNACGVCNNCLLIDKLQHPNVKIIFPLPRGKNEVKADGPYDRLENNVMDIVLEQLDTKSRNPYHHIRIPKGAEIKVSSIREIKRGSFLRSSEKGRPVVIISDAEKMNTEASNSFLKTLEEPTGNLLLILTTSHRDSLLPTITSRCQHIPFDPLREDEILSALRINFDLPHETCVLASKLANGSYSKAIELLDEDHLAHRQEIVEFLRAVWKQDPLELMKYIQPISESNDRQFVVSFLTGLAWWFRDIGAIQEGAGERIVNVDHLVPLQKFADHFPDAHPEEAIKNIELSIEFIQKNLHISLVLVNLAQKLYQCIKPSIRY